MVALAAVLTPLLVGDGQKLTPIDYMVWKDHVNVLDQKRIFKLLAKGPRLDGYLAQVKRAEKPLLHCTLFFCAPGQPVIGTVTPFTLGGPSSQRKFRPLAGVTGAC